MKTHEPDVAFEGQAQVGDTIRLPNGELRTVVSVTCAGDVIESIVERSIALRAPNFMRHSITATCALFGDTRGREKRDHERYRAKVNGVHAHGNG